MWCKNVTPILDWKQMLGLQEASNSCKVGTWKGNNQDCLFVHLIWSGYDHTCRSSLMMNCKNAVTIWCRFAILSCLQIRGILNALTRYSNVSTFQYVDFILKWEGIWAHNCIWKWTCILGKVFLLKSIHLSVYYISWKWITNSIWNPFEIFMPPGWKSQMKLGYNSYPGNGYTFQGTFD